jgi:hypothetical protein
MSETGDDTLAWARRYRARGWKVLPVAARGKAPVTGAGWQDRPTEEEDLPRWWGDGAGLNIGVQLGGASGGLVDVDLDCAEALAAADLFLPATGAVFGRAGAPRAHRLYVCPGAPDLRLRAPDGKALAELRAGESGGRQTVFPPSVHVSGERIAWDGPCEPAAVPPPAIEVAVYRLAAAALLARCWPAPGGRHDAYVALGGALAHLGLGEEDAALIVRAVCAATGNPPEDDKPLAAVRDSYRKRGEGRKVSGWPTLTKVLANGMAAERAREWLAKDLPAAADPAESAPKGLSTTCLAGVSPKPIRWLVPKLIPAGKQVIFAGEGGQCKSTLTLSFAAAITTGQPAFGLAYESPPAGDVLLISCEDDFEDTIVPRLLAAGADLNRCHRVDGTRGPDDKVHPFSLAHVDAVRKELARRPGVRLIVIDPATAYVGRAKVDDHRDSELRALLGPLSEVAAEFGVCVILVMHVNKNGAARAIHRVLGGVAYVNASRAAFLVSADPDKPGERLLLPLKANLSPDRGGIAFRPAALPPEEARAIVGRFPDLPETDRAELAGQLFRLAWLGRVDKTPDDVLKGEPCKAERCAEWLRTSLGGYAWPDKEVEQAVKAAGFSFGDFKRAKAALRKEDLHSRAQDFGGVWWLGFGEPSGWKPRPEGAALPSHPAVRTADTVQTGETGETEPSQGNSQARDPDEPDVIRGHFSKTLGADQSRQSRQSEHPGQSEPTANPGPECPADGADAMTAPPVRPGPPEEAEGPAAPPARPDSGEDKEVF